MYFYSYKTNLIFFEFISIIILLDISLCIVVFPFNTIIENRNGEINENSEQYNSTHFLNDYFTRLNYIPMKIGNPPQEVNILLTSQDCGFKIGNSIKCKKYMNNYLSYYNRNFSNDFKYTNYSEFKMYEFNNEGNSAEDTIFAYDDLQLKNIKNFQNIGFYLGSDTNHTLCGIIGFKLDGYNSKCSKINNIVKSFKSNDIINNYKWSIKYNTLDEGLFIIGGNMEDIIPNYNSKNMFTVNSVEIGMIYCWGIGLRKIICNNNITINKYSTTAEIDNNFSLIKGSHTYLEYIEKNFFKEYYSKGICNKSVYNYDRFHDYYAIECEKEKFGINDINKFPSLSFLIYNSETILDLEGKDLFTETKYKYFFNVIFNYYDSEQWIFGKIFFKKFPTIIDSDKKEISIYNNYNKEMSNDENSNNSFKFKILYLVVFAAFIIFGILCYLLGKNLNKIRKKKANELNDDYDYTPAKNNNIENNNVINNDE